MVELFNKGGIFMWPILALLLVGLGFSIERIITLTRASVNTRKFLARLHSALQDGGIEGAAAECEKTPGPVASILHAGLSRADKGLDSVEKSISNAGSIEMAFLERGMVVLSTVIVLAPMVGFTGTVQGMVTAFQQIETKNDISPAIVAGGISQALLTTLFGLVVAMIIQVFYNFFTSRIDKLILDMEESSVELMDALVDLDHKN
ncbi:MAG: MotA/TolQ/ExbB proton channel family protein [Calditrichaeota bacterium]|nr:MAG: MotA/TolQ/ExbB proton channel family protein [Calditrichota bacterium]MBL1207460.1 MotA/TolQ/ExbB proton channel family protein [Calditrichota bacterium]NOG47292.1 MotA/TolQ/ExbB proton channel family protein [Calditrichota bacterium]